MKPHDNPSERAFVCPSCGYTSYPKIAPAVITLVTKGDKVLLQRNTHYKGVVWSLVAGFVDAGESQSGGYRPSRDTRGDMREKTFLPSRLVQPWRFAPPLRGRLDFTAKEETIPSTTNASVAQRSED